jgi:hypothetical protein
MAALYAGLSHFLPIGAAGNVQLVATKFPNLAHVWSGLYGLGGAAILLGLLRRSPRIEGFGLHLLGSGVTVACLAALVIGARPLPTLIVQGGVIAACIARLLTLRRL